MSSLQSVVGNRDLLTYIFEYLDVYDLKRLNIRTNYKHLLHIDYIVPQHNILLYGQVQSGKTSKIMEYIKTFKPNLLKIVIIQNNKHMLSQYSSALSNNQINFTTIDSTSNSHTKSLVDGTNALITIYNKFRINHLQQFMYKHNIQNYSLVLDESDQYLRKIKNTPLLQNARFVLHVTATPFQYLKANKDNNESQKSKSKFMIDNVITIPPPNNYVGLDKVDIITVPESTTFAHSVNNIKNILNTDFLKQKEGFMLINCFRFVADMKQVALTLSTQFHNVPFLVLSTQSYIYENGTNKKYNLKNIKSLIDGFNTHSHIVVIANRLSLRGMNYTNSTYSRFITHQISIFNRNYTNFLQKCRIFGIRKEEQSNAKLYCLVKDNRQINFIERLKRKVSNLFKSSTIGIVEPKPKKITVKELKELCRSHKIKGFSKLNKQGLIELLTTNGVDPHADISE